ncbi:hypothetical protein [Otoolea muris]|uniref:hypothetical protein n=1 Tax=Otoolea muris TaxID=2941515 RepID=UPI00203B0FCD|nr:hypothetical protein [Otoolea muris]
MDDRLKEIDRLLKKQCWLIDVLPEQVPADAGGCFFEVEQFWLGDGERCGFADRFAGVILKLMCYYRIAALGEEWMEKPSPGAVCDRVKGIMGSGRGTFHVLFPEEDALIVLEGGDLYLSVYNPDDTMQRRLRGITASEGLFFRKAAVNNC